MDPIKNTPIKDFYYGYIKRFLLWALYKTHK